VHGSDTPLVDLHRHLEGSIRLETVLELSAVHGLPLPAWDLAGLRRAVCMDGPLPDLLQILPRFAVLTRVLTDYADCRRVARECLEDAAREGLSYLELRFSPLFMAEPHGLDPQRVTTAVCEAWEQACGDLPLRAGLVVILSRTYGPEACWAELEAALSHRDRGVVGLDLAGDEARWPAELFVRHFQRARDGGLHLTAHAGEFAGPESVRSAVLALGVERVGHAVRAAEDPGVLELLAERQIAVECCPTSNLYTGAVPDLRSHPLPLFLARGIRATLATDDPTLMGQITLQHELRVARDEMGLSTKQLELLLQNGMEAAFCR
jgi:adenosine deaminase